MWNDIFVYIDHIFLEYFIKDYADRSFPIADLKVFENYGDHIITTNQYDETKIIVWDFEEEKMSLDHKILDDIDPIAV